MSRRIVLVLLMAGLALPLIAKEPAPVDDSAQRHAAAEKLLGLFNMDETYDQAMNMAVGMVESQDLPDPEKASARKAVVASMTISMEKFSWKHMKGIFIDIYSSVLALDELEGLIAFYESPIDQKYLKKRPQLNLATMEKMQQLMEEMMPDLQKAVDETIQVEAVIELYGE